jgi:hypothetical protein
VEEVTWRRTWAQVGQILASMGEWDAYERQPLLTGN